jgi:hypothetical protein
MKERMLIEKLEVLNELLRIWIGNPPLSIWKEIEKLQIEISALKEQGKEEETNHFEIDFDGNCKADISIVNNKLVVNYAMSGWGEPIDMENIRVTTIKVK